MKNNFPESIKGTLLIIYSDGLTRIERPIKTSFIDRYFMRDRTCDWMVISVFQVHLRLFKMVSF